GLSLSTISLYELWGYGYPPTNVYGQQQMISNYPANSYYGVVNPYTAYYPNTNYISPSLPPVLPQNAYYGGYAGYNSYLPYKPSTLRTLFNRIRYGTNYGYNYPYDYGRYRGNWTDYNYTS
ncbi:uncharacterized protein B0P05DRAFT_538193, partial [Gilbertella persicaria]|uniref:uncharacterized protein n=1 Tax=Gilbertella persicaria TaxID=101096 RepID=UPI00222018B9